MTLSVRELTAEEMSAPDDSATRPYTLVVYGADRAGIVYRVTDAAARHAINIIDLRTRVTGSTTAPIYSLVMELEIGPPEAAEALRRDLAVLRSELMVDVSLEAVEVDDL